MKKIRNKFKQKKAFLAILLIFWIYMLWVMMPFSQSKGTTVEKKYGLEGNQTVGEILDGSSVTQKFIAANDNLSSIKIYLATFERENSGTLKVKISCLTDKKEVDKKVISCKDIENLSYYDFSFEKQKDSKGKEYEIEILGEGGTTGNAVTTFLSGELPLPEGVSPAVYAGQEFETCLRFCVIYENSTTLQLVKIIAWIVLVIFSLIGVMLIDKPDERSFLIIAGLMGILIIFYNPFFHAIDESTHFFRSNAISHGILIDQKNEVGEIGAYISDNYTKIAGEELSLKSYFENPSLWDQRFSAGCEFVKNPYMSSVIPINHAVSTVGIFLANHLGMSALGVILLSRLSDLVFYILCCYLAIRNMRYYKSFFFVVSLLPMSMWLAGSCSQDPVLNGAALLFVSICLKYCLDEEKEKVTKLDMGLLLLCTLSIVSVKYLIYAPLLLMYFLIPRAKMEKKYHLGVLISGIVIILFCLGAQVYLLKLMPFEEDRNGNVNVFQQIQYIFTHIASTVRNFLHYAVSMVMFHLEGLHYQSGTAFISEMLSIFSLAVFPFLAGDKYHWSTEQKKKIKWLFALISIVIYGLTAAALYVGFTPVGAFHIDGLQTRYFIPILIPVMILVSMWNVKSNIKNLDRFIAFLMMFGLLDMLSGMLLEVFA